MSILRLKITSVFLLLMSFGFAVEPSFAKGPPDKVEITGPGLSRTIEIYDEELLTPFSIFSFEDINKPIDKPLNPGTGYVVTRFAKSGRDYVPWDTVIYYPGSSGERGIAFYEGLIGPSWSEFDGKWYQMTENGDASMKLIISLNRQPIFGDVFFEYGQSNIISRLLFILANNKLHSGFSSIQIP